MAKAQDRSGSYSGIGIDADPDAPAIVVNASAARQKDFAPAAEAGKQSYVAPSREGKLHISAWLDPSYKARIRAIQMMHPEKTLQELYSEALEQLFDKYNVRSLEYMTQPFELK